MSTSTMHPVAEDLHNRMLACVPDDQRQIFDRLEEINDELRRTDVRLMDSPTDEQIHRFLSLLDEGTEKLAAFDRSNVLQTKTNDRILVINFLFNLDEVIRCHRLRAHYTWRERVQLDPQLIEGMEE